MATTFEVPVLMAVNAGIFPDPLEAIPIVALELVQVKVPPVGVLVKLVAATTPVLQTVTLAGTVAVGIGLTVMVKVEAVPVQPFKTGVTVIVPVIGVEPLFVAVKEGIFPVPLDANPILVLEFVHVGLPPAGTVVKGIAGTVLFLHTDIFAGTFTVAFGFTTKV